MNTPTVSMVKDAYTTETKEVPPDQVIEAIRKGRWREYIEQIRQETDKEKASKYKAALPGVLFSGRFSERKNSALIQHSGLLCADLDKLNGELLGAREKLFTSPYLWALFVSPSGEGIKAVFRVPADGAKHKASFRAVDRHVKELTGVQVDEACKDVARLCFVSFDPDVYHNPNATQIEPLTEPEKPLPARINGELPPDMPLRERIASELIGALAWSEEKGGFFCRCPGEESHTSGTAEKHTIVYLDTVPTIKCQHNSCSKVVEAFSTQLRSLIGKAEREVRTKLATENNSYCSSTQSVDDYPQQPSKHVFQGLAGDAVRCIAPHTEADPIAVLVQFLAAFGSVIGRNAFTTADGSRHGTNFFAVLVGESSKARKGTSWSHVLRIFERAAGLWREGCIANGLSTGEGLIWAVRDPITKAVPIKEKGKYTGNSETVTVDDGVPDKRLTVVEGEFANVLKVMAREGNTLSPIIRSAWETGYLRSLTKNFPARATDAHISIIGHITREELRRLLTETESANGFANRFLWLAVRRSKCLPEGGNIADENLNDIVRRLHSAIEFGGAAGEVSRNDSARELWAKVYPKLSDGKPGLLGAITARAEAQVLRLSVIYALLDCSTIVRSEHLKAALALWSYCERSARWIFGTATGNSNADSVLAALNSAGNKGLTRTEIIENVFKRNLNADALSRTLDMMKRSGIAFCKTEATATKTRERWFSLAQGYEFYEFFQPDAPNNSYNSLRSTQETALETPVEFTRKDQSQKGMTPDQFIAEVRQLFNAKVTS